MPLPLIAAYVFQVLPTRVKALLFQNRDRSHMGGNTSTPKPRFTLPGSTRPSNPAADRKSIAKTD